MYSYYSEIMLITKSLYEEELLCWLKWHLDILHFDHIVIFDNESTIDINKIILQFPKEKIEYYFINGWPDQFSLYNNFIKKSKSLWILPLDDDEYLYIGDKFNHNINKYILNLYNTYPNHMYYILWNNLFSKEYINKKSDLFINTHTYYSYPLLNKLYYYWPQDNGWGKCLINKKYDYNYFYNKKNSTGHIPLCLTNNNHVLLVNGKSINQEHINHPLDDLYVPDCFIAHYQYKTKYDWVNKCTSQRINRKEESLISKENIYDMLYNHHFSMKECFLLKKLWCSYINDFQVSKL